MPALDGHGLRRADPPPSHFKLAVIAALDVERRCLDGRDSLLEIWQSGPGPERAANAARQAIANGATALLSWGLAGALVGDLSAGIAVVPRAVLSEDGRRFGVSAQLRSALVERLAGRLEFSPGNLLTVTGVLASPDEKRRAAARFDAVACDMESAAIAEVAASAGVAFAAVRVVTDHLGDRLPHAVAQWVDEAGNRRLWPVMRAAIRPSQWRPLVLVALRFGRARRTLERIAAQLVSADLCRGAARA